MKTLPAPPPPAVGAEPDPDAPSVWILSRNLFQNRLLAAYLTEAVSGLHTIETLSEWVPPAAGQAARPSLVLWDCFAISAADLWLKLALGGAPEPAEIPMALFNVDPVLGNELECQAIERHLRGVFYTSDPPERLAKGIAKMVVGELWYSRQTTSRVLMDPRRFRPRDEAREAMLTAREKEILIAIAAGGANIEIADEFRISLNTVKTHLYNIYKKIDVRNRLEATLWVARYL